MLTDSAPGAFQFETAFIDAVKRGRFFGNCDFVNVEHTVFRIVVKRDALSSVSRSIIAATGSNISSRATSIGRETSVAMAGNECSAFLVAIIAASHDLIPVPDGGAVVHDGLHVKCRMAGDQRVNVNILLLSVANL